MRSAVSLASCPVRGFQRREQRYIRAQPVFSAPSCRLSPSPSGVLRRFSFPSFSFHPEHFTASPSVMAPVPAFRRFSPSFLPRKAPQRSRKSGVMSGVPSLRKSRREAGASGSHFPRDVSRLRRSVLSISSHRPGAVAVSGVLHSTARCLFRAVPQPFSFAIRSPSPLFVPVFLLSSGAVHGVVRRHGSRPCFPPSSRPVARKARSGFFPCSLTTPCSGTKKAPVRRERGPDVLCGRASS